MTAVGFVVMNRIPTGSWGDTMMSVLTWPHQFKGYRAEDPTSGGASWSKALSVASSVLNGTAEDQTQGAVFCGDGYWGDLNDRVYCRMQEHSERITGFWYDTIPSKDEIESRVEAGTMGKVGKVFFMTRDDYTDYQRYCKWLEPTPQA